MDDAPPVVVELQELAGGSRQGTSSSGSAGPAGGRTTGSVGSVAIKITGGWFRWLGLRECDGRVENMLRQSQLAGLLPFALIVFRFWLGCGSLLAFLL